MVNRCVTICITICFSTARMIDYIITSLTVSTGWSDMEAVRHSSRRREFHHFSQRLQFKKPSRSNVVSVDFFSYLSKRNLRHEKKNSRELATSRSPCVFPRIAGLKWHIVLVERALRSSGSWFTFRAGYFSRKDRLGFWMPMRNGNAEEIKYTDEIFRVFVVDYWGKFSKNHTKLAMRLRDLCEMCCKFCIYKLFGDRRNF